MHKCATLSHVTSPAQQFGARVRRQRELIGLSQAVAARRAGLSPSGWRKIEQAANVGLPERSSVMQVARVLDWDPDEELRKLGLEPLAEGERVAPPRDPRAELDRLWRSLSEPQRWALVHVAATMAVPRQWPEYGESGWSRAGGAVRVVFEGSDIEEDDEEPQREPSKDELPRQPRSARQRDT